MQEHAVPVTGVWPQKVSTSQREGILPTSTIMMFAPHRRDMLNIGLIVAAVIALLLVVSPVRNFVITDDWCYAQSVDAMLKGVYRPHEYSMATAIGHIWWGALASFIFGAGFTTLSYTNLVISTVCLLLFYLLLRQLNVSAAWAAFAVAMFGGSAIFVYVSYSFMTDVTFVTYSLAALFCYVRAAQYDLHAQQLSPSTLSTAVNRIQLRITMWLFAGSVFATLAYLTRQLGLVLPAVALAYLWWNKTRFSWQRIGVLVTLPAIAAISFTLWQKSYPPSIAAYVESTVRSENLAFFGTFIFLRTRAIILSLFLVGLMLLPFIRLRRKDVWAVVVFLALLLVQLSAFAETGTMAPRGLGNIMDHNGLLMPNFENNAILPEWLYTCLAVLSSAMIALFVSVCLNYIKNWLRNNEFANINHSIRNKQGPNHEEGAYTRCKGKEQTSRLSIKGMRNLLDDRPTCEPAWLIYGFAGAITGVTSVFSYALGDRYWLPVLPAVLLLALRFTTRDKRTAPQAWRWVIALPLIAFTIVNQQHYMAVAQARWDAAEELVQQGVRYDHIFMGMEWAGWYLVDEGAAYFHSPNYTSFTGFPPYDVTTPEYRISEKPFEGYRQIGSVAYGSWLSPQGKVFILEATGEGTSIP